ncbi:hypothetical protein BDN72DRAFT_954077 [Pluteus cervinus]|uniref:Uncharacterized protein n=1 Tax=Pluteus cervinus TaxID=181527 RepID=A0ACD3BEL5_9AGAR|nr:hypothetical protein BDN72DRAFT_954077 [Pluteus cervinus]
MSYRDPYAEQYRTNSHDNYHPSQSQPQQYQPYGAGDSGQDNFNPYLTTQPHQTYDQGGATGAVSATAGGYDGYDHGYQGGGGALRDPYAFDDDRRGYHSPEEDDHHDYSGRGIGRQTSRRQAASPPVPGPQRGYSLEQRQRNASPPKLELETKDSAPYGRESVGSGFDRGEFTPRDPKDQSARAIRNYRLDYRGNLWSKGSRGRCIGRFFFCTVLILLFLVISVFLALALWIRPPNILINNVAPASTTGSTVQVQTGGVNINLGVAISVNNPNYFDVNFRTIKAEIFYPIANTPIGGGESNNVVFKSHTLTNWTFPFSIDYQVAKDPGGQIILDLSRKCGLSGTPGQLTVNYKITLGLRILFITINPVVSNSFSFDCPLSPQQIEGLLQSAGVSGLAGFLGDL